MYARSLGDLMAATVGCTSDPEVTYVTLRPEVDQFLVMASDGVWDVLTNDQVCVGWYYSPLVLHTVASSHNSCFLVHMPEYYL
jgi:hypothetical protein